MSIINQMLRDLDARGAASTDLPAAKSHAPDKKRHSSVTMALLLLLLLLTGGVAGYFGLPGATDEIKQPASAVIAQREPVSMAVEVAPPIDDDPQPVPEPPAAKHAPARAPAVPKSPGVLTGQMERPPVVTKSVIQETTAIPASPKAEPAVVKKMSELTPEAEAQQYFDEAQALRRAGRSDSAIGKFRLALERNRGMRDARLQLARLLQESGQPDAAFSLLKAGFDEQPDGGLAIATGRLLADQGRRDEALVWLERGRESLRPPDHALMGALLSQSQRYEDAVKAYQRALAVEPDQGGWLLGLGLALESSGRIDEAKMAYRNALQQGAFKPEVVKFLRQKIGVTGS